MTSELRGRLRGENLRISHARAELHGGLVAEDCNIDMKLVRFLQLPLGGTAIFRRCVFRSSRFYVLPGTRASFEECSFVGADIKEFSAMSVDLVSNRFEGRVASLSVFGRQPGARWWSRRNVVRSNDFTECLLSDCDFSYGAPVTTNSFGPGSYVVADIGSVIEAVEVAQRKAPASEPISIAHQMLLEKVRHGQSEFYVDRWRTGDNFTREVNEILIGASLAANGGS